MVKRMMDWGFLVVTLLLIILLWIGSIIPPL